MQFQMAGYELVHHGEGRWNGVAIAARQGLGIDDIVTNFGDGPVRDSGPGAGGLQRGRLRPVRRGADAVRPSCGGVRFVCLYAPNGRVVGSPFYEGKLRWFERLRRWLGRDPVARRAAGRGRRLQRHAGRRGRLGSGEGARRHPRVRARARGARAAARVGPRRRATGSRTQTRRAASRGGTTAPACSTATRACGSTCST